MEMPNPESSEFEASCISNQENKERNITYLK